MRAAFPFPTTVALEPTVVDGLVMLQATSTDAPDSAAAEQTVRDLRDAVHAVDPDAIVGGVTATAVDTDDTSIRDRTVIIPVVLLVILLILMLLLRSILAPVLLVATVVVSFAAALGVSALVFDDVFGTSRAPTRRYRSSPSCSSSRSGSTTTSS